MLEDRFRAFFRAVNDGHDPYPWQCRLVARIAKDGVWPTAITAPTGAGKSSVVDVHVFLMAEYADGRLDVRPPRRLVLVAPRRVLVDDQHQRAQRLAHLLDGALRGAPTTDDQRVVREAAEALVRLVSAAPDDHDAEPDAHAGPLLVTALRGGIAVNTAWRLDPTCCQVVCATPLMFGSRLLFRGFRAAPRSRNLEAGLLGHDAVAVIDEAHLNERLVDTCRRIAGWSSHEDALQTVAMSATHEGDADGHGLTNDDAADPSLAQRVRAPKEVVLVDSPVGPRHTVSSIVDEVLARREHGTAGVFVNTVDRALQVARTLRKHDSGLRIVVVCSRLRPADLQDLRDRFPGLLDARGNADVDVLVSTQSLEVGVDLDLPCLISELAPAPALAQRVGRLNRSGRFPKATFVVVGPADPAELKDGDALPYAAEDLAEARRWLERLEGDASPSRIAERPMPLPRRPFLPSVFAADLETWSMTSTPVAADPDVELYLQTPDDRRSWSVDVAVRALDRFDDAVAGATLRAAPPRHHELVTFALRRAVAGDDAHARETGFAAGKPLRAVLDVVSRAEDAATAWILRNDGGKLITRPLRDTGLLPNDVLVLPAGLPIGTEGIIGVPSAGRGTTVTDVMAQAPQDDRAPDAVLPVDETSVDELLASDPLLARRATRDQLAQLPQVAKHPDVARALRRRLRDTTVTWCAPDVDPDRPPPGGASPGALVVCDVRRSAASPRTAVTEDLVTLETHQHDVATRMAEILQMLANVADDERDALVQAARRHDEGKRHPRFQRRMGADPDGVPVAKPVPGHVADRGDGWRHEQLSAAYAAAAGLPPLAQQPIATHHGCGRWLFDRDAAALVDGWPACPDDVRDAAVALFGPGGTYEAQRRTLQRQIGVHRLAYLEALLRCADVQVSREGR